MTHRPGVIWPMEPHTRAKHAILTYYLRAWFAIQSRVPKRLLYVDGFAGPGEYSGGEPGSPILALQAAADADLLPRLTKPGMELVFIFIEEREDRFRNLEQRVSQVPLPSSFRVHPINSTFEGVVGDILKSLEEQGKKLAPSLVFIDPFGPTGFPMRLVERLAAHPRAEVLINFSYQPLNQWFLQDPLKHPRLSELFGDERWRPALDINDPEAKENFLVEQYRSALGERGWRGTAFRMINEHNQTQYYLLFGTKHYLGMLAMKGAMWNAAPEGTFLYSDMSNPNQPKLFSITLDNEYARDLANLVFENRKGTSTAKQQLVENELAWHPTAVERHLTQALRLLEYKDQPPRILAVTKTDGKKRRARSYPDNCVIQFAKG